MTSQSVMKSFNHSQCHHNRDNHIENMLEFGPKYLSISSVASWYLFNNFCRIFKTKIQVWVKDTNCSDGDGDGDGDGDCFSVRLSVCEFVRHCFTMSNLYPLNHPRIMSDSLTQT